jgi:hypothetical protein
MLIDKYIQQWARQILKEHLDLDTYRDYDDGEPDFTFDYYDQD